MYKSIQACRFLAALLVVLHHLGSAMASDKYFGAAPFAVPFIAGDAGVEFFFVLSGFIITWSHFSDFGRYDRLYSYLRKRAVRIFPTYWIVFGAIYLLALASSTLRLSVPHDFATLLKSLLLIPQDVAVVGGSGAPVLIVAWSLQYEMCFYLLFAFFIANRAAGTLVSALLLVNLAACHMGACTFPRSFFSNNLILLFGLGALIAYCGKHSLRISRPAAAAAVSAIAFLSYGIFEAAIGTEFLPIDRRLMYGLLSGVLIFSLIQLEDSGRLRIANRWMPLMGNASYALYLIHYPLVSALCKVLVFMGLAGRFGAAIAYPVIFGACIVTSLAFHLFVEKPILQAFSNRKAVPTLAQETP